MIIHYCIIHHRQRSPKKCKKWRVWGAISETGCFYRLYGLTVKLPYFHADAADVVEVGVMEATQHPRLQLRGNSCRDALALTGPFVPTHHRCTNTKILHSSINTHTHTHTFSPALRAQGWKQRSSSRRSFFYNPFHVHTAAAWIRSDPPTVMVEKRFNPETFIFKDRLNVCFFSFPTEKREWWELLRCSSSRPPPAPASPSFRARSREVVISCQPFDSESQRWFLQARGSERRSASSLLILSAHHDEPGSQPVSTAANQLIS